MKINKTHMACGLLLLIALILIAPLFWAKDKIIRKESAFWNMRIIISSLEGYHRDFGNYPSTKEGLTRLRYAIETENRQYPLPLFIDPWGTAYYYNSPGVHNPESYDLWTYGADGKPGGKGNDGDIYNWKENVEGQLVKHEQGVLFVPYGDIRLPRKFKENANDVE